FGIGVAFRFAVAATFGVYRSGALESTLFTAMQGFVRANGNQFTLAGQPFRVAGANNYYLGFGSDSMVESVFELAVKMGFTTLRTWGFLDCGATAPADGICFQYLNSDTGKPDFNDGPTGLER